MFRKVHLFTVKDREEAQMVADTIGEQLVNLQSIEVGKKPYYLLNNMERAAVARHQVHLAYRLPHFYRCESIYPEGFDPRDQNLADLTEITHVNLFRIARPDESDEKRPAAVTFMATSSWVVRDGVIEILRGPNYMRAEKVWNKAYFDSIHDSRPARMRWRQEQFEQMAIEEFLGVEDAEPSMVQRTNCSRRLYVCDEIGVESLGRVAMYPTRSIFDHPNMRKGWEAIPEDRDITFEEFNDLLCETVKAACLGEPYCWFIPVVFDADAIYIQIEGRFTAAGCFLHRAALYVDMLAYVKGTAFNLLKTKLLGSGTQWRIDRKSEYFVSKPTINYKKRHDMPRGAFQITPAQLGICFADPDEIIARGLNDLSGLHMTDNRSVRALSRFGEYCQHLGVDAVMNVDACYRMDRQEQLITCAEVTLTVGTNIEWEKSFSYAVQLPECAFKSHDDSYLVDQSQLREREERRLPYDPSEPLEAL